MSFLLRKPCKTDRTCSITVSPAEGSSEWMRNWGRCFSMALGAGAVSGPYVSWPCLLGIFFRGQFAAVLFPAAWQETAYVMLSRGSESCSGILLLTVSCWSPQQVVVLVCSVSNKHHHFPLCLSCWELVAQLISSCWRLPCSPRQGPTALRWTWLGWAGTVPCWGLWLPFLRDVPSFLPFLCLVVMPGGGWEELGGGCEDCSRGCSHTDTLQACKRGDARQHQTGCGSGEGKDLGFFLFY